jgi:hypothetical protein
MGRSTWPGQLFDDHRQLRMPVVHPVEIRERAVELADGESLGLHGVDAAGQGEVAVGQDQQVGAVQLVLVLEVQPHPIAGPEPVLGAAGRLQLDLLLGGERHQLRLDLLHGGGGTAPPGQQDRRQHQDAH